MAEFRPASADQETFLQELLEAGLLFPSGAAGVYGRSATFERLLGRVDALITEAAAADGAETMRFPPVLPRRQLEEVGYLKSFPHLAGTVWGFEGGEAEALEQEERASLHEDWGEHQSMSDLVLTPAACYPVYPAVARRGRLPEGGVTVDAGGAYVFRNEPSGDPARLRMFHQREIVRIGTPDEVAAWRETWRDRSTELLSALGLDVEVEVANDPFFGRSGRMLAANQRQQALKFELLVPIGGPERTAVASFNYHQDHFGETYGLELADGGTAHTSCLGFGLERITLALLREHGLDPDRWSEDAQGAVAWR